MVDNINEIHAHRPNMERYMGYMNSSLGDKLQHILPSIEVGGFNSPTILSVGAGTGILERALADIVPGSSVIALDASLPMLEKINPQAKDEEVENRRPVIPLLADAENIPLQDNSVDVVILSSVVHEIASYKNDYEFSEGVRNFFENTARILKKGGRVVVRDFVQPENPNEEVRLNIGEKKDEDEMDPLEFIDRFANEFKGDDLKYIVDQIKALKAKGEWGKGVAINVLSSHAFEILAHYSWSKSFGDEIKEKYAYLPLKDYISFIQDAFSAVSADSRVVDSNSYIQEGYVDHIKGRMGLTTLDGQPVDLPHFTGLIVIEKK